MKKTIFITILTTIIISLFAKEPCGSTGCSPEPCDAAKVKKVTAGNEPEKKNNYITTETGLKYAIIREGKGKKPKPGDIVEVHYTGKLEDGTIFDSSIERGKPIHVPIGKGKLIKGWDEALLKFKKGTKAHLIIPPELGYGDKAVGKIPANSTIIFDVELIDINKVKNKSKISKQKLLNIEPFDTTGVKPQTTKSGLKYYVIEQGEGKNPPLNSKVTVHYSGFLENGKMFDSSKQRQKPFSFSLGKGRVIKGWDEGVALMKKGSKFKFIIPSELGYGSRGVGPIPPNSTLIFDVELVNYK